MLPVAVTGAGRFLWMNSDSSGAGFRAKTGIYRYTAYLPAVLTLFISRFELESAVLLWKTDMKKR